MKPRLITLYGGESIMYLYHPMLKTIPRWYVARINQVQIDTILCSPAFLQQEGAVLSVLMRMIYPVVQISESKVARSHQRAHNDANIIRLTCMQTLFHQIPPTFKTFFSVELWSETYFRKDSGEWIKEIQYLRKQKNNKKAFTKHWDLFHSSCGIYG